MFWCNVVFNRGLSWSTRTVKNATSYWLREGFIRSQKPVKKSQKSLDRVPTNLRKSFNYENISFIYLCHFCRKHNSNIFFSCLEDFLETIHVLNVYCFLCIIKFNFLKQIHVNVYDFFFKSQRILFILKFEFIFKYYFAILYMSQMTAIFFTIDYRSIFFLFFFIKIYI